MCLVIFAHQCSPHYPLVVSANRDEFHARPTQASHFWESQPQVLAGRDLEQGGTWMGTTRTGRFAAITNVSDPSRTTPAPLSRGELTLSFLAGESTPEAYLAEIEPRADQYALFNLVVGDQHSLWVFSNAHGNRAPKALAPGLYGLSNAALDTPWPKVQLGKSMLAGSLDRAALTHEELAMAVQDRHLAKPEELTSHGLTGEMDQALSAQFITAGVYGTRSTTTLWQTRAGTTHWRELSFNDVGQETGCVEESFRLETAQSIGL
ncbi:MAG: NRDE family protein [Halioglobus sp.]